MVNAFAAYFLDVAGPRIPAAPGDVYVPPYDPGPAPDSVLAARAALFGTAPDWTMRSYRLAQVLPILHASPLGAFALALDPRITYDPLRPAAWPATLFRPRIAQASGPAAPPGRVVGTPATPDASGVTTLAYAVAVEGSSVVVSGGGWPGVARFLTVAPAADGTQGPIPLPGSGYDLVVGPGADGTAYTVAVVLRPRWGPGQLVEAAAGIGEAATLDLFGIGSDEPSATLRNLWDAWVDTPLRLAALATALVLRTAAGAD